MLRFAFVWVFFFYSNKHFWRVDLLWCSFSVSPHRKKKTLKISKAFAKPPGILYFNILYFIVLQFLVQELTRNWNGSCHWELKQGNSIWCKYIVNTLMLFMPVKIFFDEVFVCCRKTVFEETKCSYKILENPPGW